MFQAYTISTAGEEGFLQILPVFLDHVLYPTMTADGFTTEVRTYVLHSGNR